MLWLKIGCVVVFIAVMTGIKFGATAFFTMTGGEFAWGFVFGCFATMGATWLLTRIDRWGEPEEY